MKIDLQPVHLPTMNGIATKRFGLFFDPNNIICIEDIMQLFVSEKKDGKVLFDIYLLEENNINLHIDGITKEQIKIAKQFLNNALKQKYAELKKAASSSNSKASELALEKSYFRFVAEQLMALQQTDSELIVMHSTINPKTGNKLNAKCTFSVITPSLSFEVRKNSDSDLYIHTFISLQNELWSADDFVRTEFLLEKSNEYFLLNAKDYQFIKWLQTINMNKFVFYPEKFLEEVVLKIEALYKLDRNNCFEVYTINEEPQATVFLSELSNMYLLLTPQWSYDGFVMEAPFMDSIELTRNGKIYNIRRNASKEKELIELLQSMHPIFAKQHKGYFYVTFDEAKKKHWFLKAYHSLLDKNIEMRGFELMTHFRYSPHAIVTKFTLKKTEGTIATADMEVGFGAENIKLQELQKLLHANQKSVMLSDDSIGILTDEWLAQYGIILKHAKINVKSITLPFWILYSVQNSGEKGLALGVDAVDWQQKFMDWQNPDSSIYETPSTINAELRSYQKKGFEWMALLSEIDAGACLADDMGLGKTLQTICFMAWLHQKNSYGKMLIICPASLIYNWKQEFAKFAPHFSVVVINDRVKNNQELFDNQHTIYISSYGIVRSRIEQFCEHPWLATILDESHHIKNPNALNTKAVNKLNTKHKIALSGTPVMNNTFDLYSQINFLLPEFLGTSEFFRKEYANPIDRDKDADKIQQLKQITAPFILRRTKKQVATDLPEKIEQIMWCEMEQDQQLFYNDVKDNIRKNIFVDIDENGLGKSKMGILAGITKLRQACCAPSLVKDANGAEISSIKLKLLVQEIVENLGEHKVLIFSQFKGMLHLIAAELQKHKLAYYHFDGDTPLADRMNMVNAFQQEGCETNLFLISLKAGNTGITLTAADYAFLVDPWWNNAVQDQAIDRAHRIGQNKTVFAYKMICKNTIEEKILAMQGNKKELSEDLVVAEENFVKSLSLEDVQYLFA